uniref:Uncharacterized protein n=1 Tax=Meloidogyne enterolobii TaxID=390850 RepID=A0A6V7UDI1_MELEN|nr:unnamed protein product [Meloidogyne enterolobii]
MGCTNFRQRTFVNGLSVNTFRQWAFRQYFSSMDFRQYFSSMDLPSTDFSSLNERF